MIKQNLDGNNYNHKIVKHSHCQNKVTLDLSNSKYKNVEVNGLVTPNF